jgi:hypothetical protein
LDFTWTVSGPVRSPICAALEPTPAALLEAWFSSVRRPGWGLRCQRGRCAGQEGDEVVALLVRQLHAAGRQPGAPSPLLVPFGLRQSLEELQEASPPEEAVECEVEERFAMRFSA